MIKKRFFVAFFLASTAMFAMSMIWHGIILNDLKFLEIDLTLFYSLAALAYLVIGFVLTFAYNYLSMGIGLKLKGFFLGVACGFFIYLIAFVLGISYNADDAAHTTVDFVWQMIEQGVGGSIVSAVYFLAAKRDEVLNRVS
jgi:hypothetical protein